MVASWLLGLSIFTTFRGRSLLNNLVPSDLISFVAASNKTSTPHRIAKDEDRKEDANYMRDLYKRGLFVSIYTIDQLRTSSSSPQLGPFRILTTMGTSNFTIFSMVSLIIL